MAEIMLGKELHPDRVISVEKLYEIFKENGIPYSFVAQHGIENNSFAVVRCKDCEHGMKSRMQPGHAKNILCKHSWYGDYHEPDHFCSYGERKTDG